MKRAACVRVCYGDVGRGRAAGPDVADPERRVPMKYRSSARDYPSHVRLHIALNSTRITATWSSPTDEYRVTGIRRHLEEGDASSLRIDHAVSGAGTATTPAFLAHLLPTMCAQLLEAAARHDLARARGQSHGFDVSVTLELG
jgi:hypothetical protein